MSFQVQDILSNPALLKEVTDETMQKWIQQYPYVPLFHLFALKNKADYKETDLHKTAFYFNNREKLYYLLNNNQHDSRSSFVLEKNVIIDIPAESGTETITEIVSDTNETVAAVNNKLTTVHPELETPEEIPVISFEIKVEPKEEIISEQQEIPVPLNEEVKTVSEATAESVQEIQIPLQAVDVEETTITAVQEEAKPLSIADQILLEMQQLKELRAVEANKIELESENKQVEIITPVTEISDTDEIKIEGSKPAETSVVENIQSDNTKSIQSENIEKPLSIQDEVIARIQKIKEERAQRLAEEQLAANNNNIDIKIVHKSDRPEICVSTELEKNPLEELLDITPSSVSEKEIDLIETKLLTELEQEMNDVDVLAKIHDTEHQLTSIIQDIPAESSVLDLLSADEKDETKVSDEIIVNLEDDNSDRFSEMFPEPLLVKVEIPKFIEQTPVANPKEVTEINTAPDKNLVEEISLKTDSPEFSTLISKDSDIFIPDVNEDEIEIPVESEIITDKVTVITSIPQVKEIHEPSIEDKIQVNELNEEVIKEPHTFVEWLKLLDGNLQIQTAETQNKAENWIEIPRYEVELTLANKKEIQKEEQKLFEPNFEEGEVDLFNEIDEEVTKVATDSVSFKQDMMTETLAKIYHKQGKTDKALEIYNALRLKFPEKSTYFAALIKKIEKEK